MSLKFKKPAPRGPHWSETSFGSEVEALAYGCFAIHAENARADLNCAGLARDLGIEQAPLFEAFKTLDEKEILSVFQGVNDLDFLQVFEYATTENSAGISDTDRLTAVCLYISHIEIPASGCLSESDIEVPNNA